VTLTDGVSAADARTLPAIIAFDNPFSLMMAAWQGHSPALSPDGRWLAYITTQATDARTAAPAQARVEIMDLETNTTRTILALADLAADQALDQLTTLQWSPDASRLALVASLGNSDVLYLLQLDTAAAGVVVSRQMIPVPFNDFELGGFSPDSQYLTVADNFVGNAASTTRLGVLDLNSPGTTVFGANGSWAAWAPSGHRLAISNAAGLYVADPITGEVQWITGGDCIPSWHTLP
jgi:Tol biopolymer transport system component